MSYWHRENLGPVAWRHPAPRIRWAEWQAWMRRREYDLANWDSLGTSATRWQRIQYYWIAAKYAIGLRMKAMAVRQRQMRLDREQEHFQRTGEACFLKPGKFERRELGYGGMHYTTLQTTQGRQWAVDLGLVDPELADG